MEEEVKGFIESMKLYNVSLIGSLESEVMVLDVKSRKSLLMALGCTVYFIGMIIISVFGEWDKGILNIFDILMLISFIIGCYFLIIGVIDIIKMLKKLKVLNKEKSEYISKIKGRYFTKEDNNIIRFLKLKEIYVLDKINELNKKMISNSLSNEEVMDIDMKIRTSILKENVLPSTTESIEDQRGRKNEQ